MALPLIVADTPLAKAVTDLMAGKVEILPWEAIGQESAKPAVGLYTFGHLRVDAALLGHLPNLKVISNYGVGVDHIHLPDAAARNIPVGNTPSVLDGATADMGFTLLLATARRLMEGDRYARSPEFTRFDPGYMLGREIHGQTLGIVGLGRIGKEVAKRALGFSMKVLYHNRRQDAAAEASMGVQYRSLDALLKESDFVMLCCPLTPETTHLIDAAALQKMRPTSILVNIARGPVVDTAALTDALSKRQIYAAGLDVTDPEPLPRDHPLLSLPNVTIAPHLGSATEQTRQRMAEISVLNLMAGIEGRPLLHQVK
ncbi:MAG: D-glycerate dehydrogenase [Pirellulales bacterium]